jgi:hypothetical protein
MRHSEMEIRVEFSSEGRGGLECLNIGEQADLQMALNHQTYQSLR